MTRHARRRRGRGMPKPIREGQGYCSPHQAAWLRGVAERAIYQDYRQPKAPRARVRGRRILIPLAWAWSQQAAAESPSAVAEADTFDDERQGTFRGRMMASLGSGTWTNGRIVDARRRPVACELGNAYRAGRRGQRGSCSVRGKKSVRDLPILVRAADIPCEAVRCEDDCLPAIPPNRGQAIHDCSGEGGAVRWSRAEWASPALGSTMHDPRDVGVRWKGRDGRLRSTVKGDVASVKRRGLACEDIVPRKDSENLSYVAP